jgi:tRNA(Ile)-lysidine synthase
MKTGPTDSLLPSARRALVERGLVRAGDTVVAAVSGGADSVALLAALEGMAPALGFRLGAAHLDHGIRGTRAARDAAFVRRLCRRLGVPLVEGHADVPALARRRKLSLEAAAREARYGFLARAARRLARGGPVCVAVAHTADDQAETVLLRLFRGAGPRGLAGMAHDTLLRGVRVIRPLLDVPRAAVTVYLNARGLRWREDETNRDPAFLRNRIRRRVLPLLESQVNPQVRAALRRTAEILREDDQWMDAMARSILRRCLAPPEAHGAGGALRLGPLRRRPTAALWRVLRLWLASAGVPADAAGLRAVERVARLASSPQASGAVSLGGRIRVRRAGATLLAEQAASGARPGRGEMPPAGPGRVRVRTPGETAVLAGGLAVHAWVAPGIARTRPRGPGALPARATLGLEAVGRRALFVRAWRPGDRMRPLGLGGSRKLQDIFTDAKVPLQRRRDVPVFECAGRIVWVPGYRVAEGWEAHDPRQPALQLRVARLPQVRAQ